MTNTLVNGGLLITSPFERQNMLNEQVARYAGFDGELWPGSNGVILPGLKEDLWETGLVPSNFMHDLAQICREIPPTRNARLLYICSDKDKRPPHEEEFRFIGVDVGYYNSSYSHFSCLLHELARGLVKDHSGKWQLNDVTLFDERDIALDFLSERMMMPNPGLKLEEISSDDKPTLIYTYRYIDKSSAS